jgi:His-Xaa-Ser system protein HxsD
MLEQSWRNRLILFSNSEGALVELTFDSRINTPLVIEKAAYKFLDRFAALLRIEGEVIFVNLDFQASVEDQDEVVRLFKIEVLDQSLREKIATATQVERNLILSYAFSRSGLMDV